MRISITKEEVQNIIDLLCKDEKYEELIIKLETQLKKEPSLKLTNAPKKATQTRVNQAKEKIINAVNMMRLEQKKINLNSVAKEAKVSYNTVKKYSKFIQEQKL